MTLLLHIGRRVPRSWFRRQTTRVAGLISFQENIWLMIKQSMNLAKKKANAAGTITFVITNHDEDEDMNYKLQWIKVEIQGNKEQEEDEYKDALKLYDSLGKVFKKDLPTDERLARHFKTKILSSEKVEQAYKEGYGASKESNLADKLLEMGILTHLEWIEDYDSRN